MGFWIIAGLMAVLAAGALVMTLLRGRVGDEHPAEYDLRVYRDQLREVDRDVARGVIPAEDAERVRAEVSRRILAADTQLRKAGEQGGGASAHGDTVIAALVGLAVLGGAALMYLNVGAPGYGDMPLQGRIAAASEKHKSRKSQAAFEATLPATPPATPSEEFADLLDRLRKVVAERPDDIRGLELLASTEARIGNMRAAYEAQERLIEAKGDTASSRDHTILANMMISAAQGYVSPEAEAALLRALELDSDNKLARYYMGLMLLQNDRPDLTFGIWRDLLEEGPQDAPWIGAIRARIEDLAWLAAEDYTPPPAAALPGPSTEDMEAAGEMSAEDRQEMIRGMVSRLSDRLASEGGTPQEWARLIGAYGVLGDTERATAIWQEAQQVFAGNPAALETVRAGARRAGIAE